MNNGIYDTLLVGGFGLLLISPVLLFLGFVIYLKYDMMQEKRLNRRIFNDGKRRYGYVIGYRDWMGNAYEDDSQDCLDDGSGKSETSYTSVILKCASKDGTDELVEVQSYERMDRTPGLLSERFKIGEQVKFISYGGHNRFASDTWLTN